jgi:putative hydrolase of the HAD superfamily
METDLRERTTLDRRSPLIILAGTLPGPEVSLTLRAAIFDYGMVISRPQEPTAHARLREITGLDHESFEKHYWADRHAYDLGQLSGATYWPGFARHANITLSDEQIRELIENDVLMWSVTNDEMLAWIARLQHAGIRTAVLSNMGADLLRYIQQEFSWLRYFDHLTWSCELGIAKPDPAIYRHTLEKLGVSAEETLFLDDKAENIAAAESVGLHSVQFTTMHKLACDLAERQLAGYFPPIA